METPTNIVVKGMLFKKRLFINYYTFLFEMFLFIFTNVRNKLVAKKTLCFSVLFQCMLSLKQMTPSQMMFFGLMISSHK